jgi:two-component sensor histidine kinase
MAGIPYQFLAIPLVVLCALLFSLGAVIRSLLRKNADTSREFDEQVSRLEASERRNRAFIKALPDLFFIIDRSGHYVDFSVSDPSLLRTVNGSVIGHSIHDIFPPALVEQFMQAVTDVLANGGLREIQYELDVPAGRRAFECRIVAMDESCALYISRDITRRLEHEAEILDSLREKEVLLREVHHRVKNNLQVISSLVALQAEQLRDREDRQKMQETQQRIQSMAQLHELLYQSGNFASIELREYLGHILDELETAWPLVVHRISLERDLDSFPASIEIAMPVGLILNELVTNSLKYAFRDGRRGTLSVRLRQHDGSAILSVTDDGPGLPAGVTIDGAETLGFLLVRSLAQQICARVRVLEGPGAAVSLEFTRECQI